MRKIATLLCVLALCACAFPAAALAAGADGSASSIKEDGVAFGLSGVERAQIGVSKTYDQRYYGYAYPLGKDAGDAFSVIVAAERIVAYVPQAAAKAAGFAYSDADEDAFENMVETLDKDISNGGVEVATLGLPWTFTDERSYEADGYVYEFGVEVEDGYYYTLCRAASKSSKAADKQAARFAISGRIVAAEQVATVEDVGPLGELAAFLSPENMDYRPLWVSLKTAGVAMVFIFVFGMLAAWRAMHVKSRWKGLFDSIFTIPMVLPPTVCGFILLVIFGQSTPFGRWLIDHGIELVFSWPAAVLAATVVGFPLMYRTVLGAFEALDVDMLDAARTLGWSERRIFVRLMLPLAWPSIAAGLVLAFARAMGEFGATLFVAGNYAGVTQTMPIAIYFAWMGGNSPVAVFWVVVVILISFFIILIINLYSAHAQRYRNAGGKRAKDADRAAEKAAAGGDASFAIDEAAAAALGFGKGGTA